MFYWFIITGSSKLPQVQKLQQTRENPVIQGDLDSSRVKSHYFYKRTIPKYTVNYLPLLGTKAGSHLVKSVQEQEQSDLAFSTLELPQSGTVHRALCAQQGAHSTTVLFSQFCSPSASVSTWRPPLTRCFPVLCCLFHWFKSFHCLHCWPQHYQFIFRF